MDIEKDEGTRLLESKCLNFRGNIRIGRERLERRECKVNYPGETEFEKEEN